MRWATLLILFGVLSWSASSRADQRRFSLEYHGSPACQQGTKLLTEIERRTASAQRVNGGPVDVTVRVTIEAMGDKQLAAVDIDGPDGRSHRDIAAPECAQLVHALALILTIAIDPDALPPDVELSASEPSPPSPPAPRRVLERAAAPPPLRWAVGLSAGQLGGVSPKPAFAQALSFELSRGPGAGFAAHLSLSGVHAHGNVDALAGVADFDLLALRLASCPYRIGTRISVAACGSFDFGRLQGRGSRTRVERTGSARWYGPGVFGAVTLSALPWLRVQLELGALTPLARDRFYFGPSETVHRIPALAGYGCLKLLVGG